MTSGGTGGVLIIVSAVLFLAGSLTAAVGNIWLLVKAFQAGVGWGLAVLFLPFANIVFAVKHWAAAKTPFLLSLAGAAAVLAAMVVSVAGGFSMLRMMGDRGGASPSFTAMQAGRGGPAGDGEAGVAKTDREMVAVKLAGAGIDPNNPRTFRGKTINAMTDALGKPSATMRTGGKTIFLFYNCFEVESEDGGRTVSDVHYMGQ